MVRLSWGGMTDADTMPLDPAAQDLLFRAARTANTFSDEPVTDAQIAAIYDLVQWGPSAANSQPLRITVVRSPEAKARLLPLMSDGNRPKTAQAPVTLLLTADLRFYRHWDRLFPHAPGGGAGLADAPETADAMARTSATLQVGYLILGIRAAGLAAGPMAGYDGPGIDAEFFPDGDQRTLVVMNVGRPGPDAWLDRLPRLPADEVITTL